MRNPQRVKMKKQKKIMIGDILFRVLSLGLADASPALILVVFGDGVSSNCSPRSVTICNCFSAAVVS